MEKKEIRLSPSAIITYIRCPREFYNTYILRLPTPPKIALIKGTIVHTVFENFFNKQFRPDFEVYAEELLNNAFEDKKNKEYWESLDLTEEEDKLHREDCFNMVNLYIHTFRLKLDNLKFIGKIKSDRHGFYLLRPKIKEKWLEDKELNLCGYVDRIHTDFNGKTTIGDYKTSSHFGIGIKDEYELQGGIYALLYNRCENKNVDYVSVILFRYGLEIVTRVTPDLVQHSLDTVQYVRDKTESRDIKDYPKAEGQFCKYCNYFEECSGIKNKDTEIKTQKSIEEIKSKKTLEK